MKYFLAKTEPGAYSIEDLEREGVTRWDGVHNHQAINVIKSWSIGDRVFIYHSMGQARIVGLGEVVTKPHKDEQDERGISWLADIRYIRTYPEDRRVSLKEVKESGMFTDFALVRQSRLSVMECPEEFVKWLEGRGLGVK